MRSKLYAIKTRGGVWGRRYFLWGEYNKPPYTFLRQKEALKVTRGLRQQYGNGCGWMCSKRIKFSVVRVELKEIN